MSDDVTAGDDRHITFNIKSSSDAKHVVTVPESMTVLDLKQKLSTSEYADTPADRQRLIYSGRVLKDNDTLAVYKIKDGNTVHMVKAAASNQRQGTTTSSASSNTTGAAAAVPQNLAAGTGNDPLAGLTGARYAGFAQMPGAGMFGPDGGVRHATESSTTQDLLLIPSQMGPPPSADAMLDMLENPMFASQMQEAMNNPAVIQMMQNNPMVRDNPMMQQMLQNPEMRRMMMDPQFIRQSMQMSRMMGGGGMGAGSMPAPGVTDTTNPTTEGGNATTTTQQSTTTNAPNPFANPFMFGAPGTGGSANPFAALFGGANPTSSPTANTNTTQSPNATPASGQTRDQNQSDQANPFGMFGGFPTAGQPGGNNNPFGAIAQQMMQNPEMMRTAMEQMRAFGMGGGENMGAGANAGGAGGEAGTFNPFAMLGGGFGSPPPAQQDTRPPEEQYAGQLRQLNDMGFFDFERNVRALRRSGGSVQGAIEALLTEL